MSFIVYDLVLLGIFVIFVTLFLYKNKKNIKKEGLLLLYKARWGIKFINYVGKKYKRTIKVLSYISIGLGYLLMIGVLWLVYTIVRLYVLRPDIVAQIKIPPIMPLIPYIDKLVPFLPPFYFTYWIVILAIIAISHEFAHGIFMKRYNINIKSTGFGFFPFFLPIFLAAFVEQDEKSMLKAKNFEQRAVLSAGTFANVITAILFTIILAGFFSASFAPAGVIFDDYVYGIVDISSISMINGINVVNPSYEKLAELAGNSRFNNITANGIEYAGIRGFVDQNRIALYHDTPALNAKLNGAILNIHGIEVRNVNELSNEIGKYSPGQTINIKTQTNNGTMEYNISLEENPEKPGAAWLGVAFEGSGGSIMNKIFESITSFKKPHVYYEPVIGDFGWFIYHLLWWLILISISVALVNMLPMGIFDGGRFFYLTVLLLTKSKEKAKKSFKWITRIFLLILLALMLFWAYALIF